MDGLLVIGDRQEIDRVVHALSLIRRHDPIRYRRLLRDLSRIWILVIPYRGQFQESTWTCQLDQRFVLDEKTPLELIASVIVHEATHARLARVGIDYREELRHRIEQVCIRRQMAFTEMLPEATEAFDEAKSMLENLPDMSDAAMTEGAFAAEVEAARHVGVPEWLLRRMIALRRWRIKRLAAKSRRN
ncbi:MAG: hypothetical protein EOR72_29225 [Mesorhizobium sp.]|uniref:hypothetical protein n=1 Tax=Mesorhizobium sp. TaxID=1871066 RepID=UPI000FE4E0D8|nr:hypothetical protein [Mesorhizobium sp.]RWM07936.1 MAG: hypothetical protein EOR72_29225 [Mesorhizobium sp.]